MVRCQQTDKHNFSISTSAINQLQHNPNRVGVSEGETALGIPIGRCAPGKVLNTPKEPFEACVAPGSHPSPCAAPNGDGSPIAMGTKARHLPATRTQRTDGDDPSVRSTPKPNRESLPLVSAFVPENFRPTQLTAPISIVRFASKTLSRSCNPSRPCDAHVQTVPGGPGCRWDLYQASEAPVHQETRVCWILWFCAIFITGSGQTCSPSTMPSSSGRLCQFHLLRARAGLRV
ncbi:hypothetical protein ZHAS_00008839 [Anopheles sinensis]|uniref:Uncharacterized protein n=1 Tax=Anopheles sinensis TaxID=74873 RepID=A0A084VTF6_ANOSI|nr:hypothetical protein ZHAS_00008839 [Anopheles sinensis]